MNNSINISSINETNTWIFVQPALGRQYDDDFKKSTVSLTWEVASFT